MCAAGRPLHPLRPSQMVGLHFAAVRADPLRRGGPSEDLPSALVFFAARASLSFRPGADQGRANRPVFPGYGKRHGLSRASQQEHAGQLPVIMAREAAWLTIGFPRR